MFFNFSPPHKSKFQTSTRQEIALKSIQKEQSITKIAADFSCSRNTVYEQQKVALGAIDAAFASNNDEEVIFYIAVTKQTLYSVVLMLHLICRASYRHVVEFLWAAFGYDISTGTVHNIVNQAAIKATAINNGYDLSKIKVSSSDEMFHRNQPILATVDIPSRFCAQAELNTSRDGNAWGVSLLFLEEQGYKPDSVIVDGAKGMTKGYQITLPDTKIRYDHFHIIRDIKDTARYLRNKESSALTAASKSSDKIETAKSDDLRQKAQDRFNMNFLDLQKIAKASQQFAILAGWLQYDVLQLAGYNYEQRAELFDFILEELQALSKEAPHRVKKVLRSLKFQRDKLLDVANTLNDRFVELSTKHGVSISDIWSICYLARYDYESFKYQQKSTEFEAVLGYELYEKVEDDVLLILENTHRCSSIVENFNSRLATFTPENKFISQKLLDLYRFFLNHSPFMRSQHAHLKGKSPAEALTGVKHDLWYKMLGFQQPKLIAA